MASPVTQRGRLKVNYESCEKETFMELDKSIDELIQHLSQNALFPEISGKNVRIEIKNNPLRLFNEVKDLEQGEELQIILENDMDTSVEELTPKLEFDEDKITQNDAQAKNPTEYVPHSQDWVTLNVGGKCFLFMYT